MTPIIRPQVPFIVSLRNRVGEFLVHGLGEFDRCSPKVFWKVLELVWRRLKSDVNAMAHDRGLDSVFTNEAGLGGPSMLVDKWQ